MEYKGRELPDIDLKPYIEVALQEFGIDLLQDTLTIDYLERLQLHINLVNYFGNKLGKNYETHDSSKITMLLPAYRNFIKPRGELTEEEEKALDIATLIHITQSPHHPEYWTSTDLSGFTRVDYTPHGIIEAKSMDEESLIHMVCDWSSVSLEKGTNTPKQWFDSVNGVRWLFTPEQERIILSTIKNVWD